MKNIILSLSVCFIFGIFTSYAQDCDTVKFKVIKTNYGYTDNGRFHTFGSLDGCTINVDTLSSFSPEVVMVNISNDTFSSNETYEMEMFRFVYADTGLIVWHFMPIVFSINKPFLPNDTVRLGFNTEINLLNPIIDFHSNVIDLDQISHWEMQIGIGYTDKDGYYTENAYYAGADTSIFYITKTPVSIKEMEQTEVSVFPNPAQSQFTVTNTEDAILTLYNIMGQEIKRVQGTAEQTTIYTDNLPAGIYVLKVEKGGAVFTKKIQIQIN